MEIKLFEAFLACLPGGTSIAIIYAEREVANDYDTFDHWDYVSTLDFISSSGSDVLFLEDCLKKIELSPAFEFFVN